MKVLVHISMLYMYFRSLLPGLFLSSALVHRRKWCKFLCISPSYPIWLCWPYQTWDLSSKHDFQISPTPSSLVRPRMVYEIRWDLASGELVTLFWSPVDHDSARCPREVPTCGSVYSCTAQEPIWGTLTPNQQDTHMCVQLADTPPSTQTPAAWHLGTLGLCEQGWPRAAGRFPVASSSPHCIPDAEREVCQWLWHLEGTQSPCGSQISLVSLISRRPGTAKKFL